MAADDDMLDFQLVDSVFHHAHAVEIGVGHDVADVPVSKDFSRFQPSEGVGLHHRPTTA